MNLTKAARAYYIVNCEKPSLPEKEQIQNLNIHVPLWQHSYAIVIKCNYCYIGMNNDLEPTKKFYQG